MRRPFIAANWKMNTTVDEAVSLVNQMLQELNGFNSVDRVLCPPFISLQAVGNMLKRTEIGLGAQNMYFKEKGAFTGEVSPLMLKDLCGYVILGHSERRQYFAETDALINQKIKAALTAGLIPIFCIGESLEQNEAGKTGDVLSVQVKGGLAGVDADDGIVIAYEPIWAIGTGRAATGIKADSTIGFIRDTLGSIWGKDRADSTRILYGGSVTGANIEEFIKQPQIDGALVGGASLKAAEFVSIVRQTALVKS
ncbi:MAG: triose-phosphate isomerase [Dehalococcoidia bacterium]|nr:triose-phosphate isomerase [Dehalococcoidia bacterium]MDD5494759.1 triose-phosphate isomerase [Dehalococcoidia bacterium]